MVYRENSEKEKWRHPLIRNSACCPPRTSWNLCCMGFCCPCVVAGQLGEALRMNCLVVGGVFCLGQTFACPCFVPQLLMCMLRGELRNQYRLPGNEFQDLVVACCYPCALIQAKKHVDDVGPSDSPDSGGWEATPRQEQMRALLPR
uniref:Uncharacterized protein n=1 Tax=Chromera velia CCMP2878 TaxID=1169474 RepID=A0A0G4ID44_9ALVE|mmetsp:Transcript_50275/g.99003  ORF Transcript_50275/g.99003 Transcript_50275/m.99003 type:complete len:146 (+) Transcript_50275:342-779(+)|eukprot:Cvel_13237.t1-p1 / transcript=Cvel_13237.t1 / gene=Cvel_13237 / organism=Chromera_velia_CCMP2878 / gene_product=Protein PLANT CADMIUM RESISTANCE 2, putative / transcript_product=Protein PLANT CADMIUM RESISTANCE 2, putative / location=Cvel_scaffold897:28992-30544(+) / protein_length=145 / sequence_SO=supercontig / SO=protein_coding / is_pseudo=false